MMRDSGLDTRPGNRPATVTDALGNVLPRAASADIGLLLEGTYPYVSGGVSSWVHDIIRAFPEYTFGLCFLGSKPDDYPKMSYPLPANVVHLELHYLYDADPPSGHVRSVPGNRDAFERIALLHEQLRRPADAPLDNRLVRRVVDDLTEEHRLDEAQFLYSQEAWTFLTDQYRAYCSDPSFSDYFWSVRLMHRPLWQLARIAEQLIPMRLYHAVSTGYAGFLGALLRHRQGRPLLISEHGIYTKERKIELFQSQWIRDNRNLIEYDASHIGYFHEMWARFFEALGKMTYAAADDIVALYEGNRRRQIVDGAPPPKTHTIPNGVDLRRLAPLRQRRPASAPKVLCLIGRVVPIKDVKTFIRAMLTVVRAMPDAEAWIAGPESEDPSYAAECRELIDRLGLSGKVTLLGMQRIDELLPKIGVLVLSSISEALPLVILEAFAAGVPVVTTDVGACCELIHGSDADDAALGAAGRLVPIADPAAIAHEALALLADDHAWCAAQAAGIARVERFYSQERMVGAYRALYSTLAGAPDRHAPDAGRVVGPASACPYAGQRPAARG
ncbi:GT4 family glycosyltransferase PelF [Burkholderia ubonensis]|uniref:GT4 family glycosyltransferase PelF n=1 Tax=Burkholderia ubonensis TaxID=101571 RepID=UPI000B130949|nr:GT4 family glycosyltransferase PelF [Burkholderia ubonensis]MDY7789025.1 GT4 family glycosyltransferase PelF [Burkholderia ubonensis]